MAKRPDRHAREQRQLTRDYEARQALHERRATRRVRDNWIAVGAIVVVAAAAIFAQFSYFQWGPGAPTAMPTETAYPSESQSPDASAPAGENQGDVPDLSLAEGRTWTGQMTIEGFELGIELDGALAPQATAMFVQAAQTGWYNGKFCPRVTSYESMQVIQCGTVSSDSTAAEEDFAFGPIENAPADDFYPAGSIAMARVGGDGWSMAHQFFIVTADSSIPSDAAGGYTIVGRVTSGLEALAALVTVLGTTDGSQDGAPASPLTISTFTIA